MNKNAFVSKAVQNIPPSGIRKFFDLTATMKDVISLGIGEKVDGYANTCKIEKKDKF